MAREEKVEHRDILSIIEEVIRAEFIPDDQTVMREDDTHGKKGSMVCHISADSRSEQVLLCKFDKGEDNKSLFPYFNEVHGFLSMCDYIMFVEDTDNLFVFLIDLKDTSNSAKPQTMYAESFAAFILERIRAVKGDGIISKPVSYRKIGVKTGCVKCTTKQYETLGYDKDYYLTLPNYHTFHTRLLMDRGISSK